MMTHDEIRAALKSILRWMERNAVEQGYGYYHPEDPRDFFPDRESCSEREIETHRAACAAWNAAGGKPDGWERPVSRSMAEIDGSLIHITMTRWGIGAYNIHNPEIAEMRDSLRAVLDRLEAELEKEGEG